MSATRPARNIGIDLLRVFSITMVVVGHAGPFPHDTLLTIWRMPLFFMLSGFFFTPSRSLQVEVTKRWDSLIIPYLSWSVVISMWLIIVLWGQDEVILEHLATGWAGGANQSIFWMAAWFITTLAAASILRRFLERFGTVVVWAVAVGGLALSYYWAMLVSDGTLASHPLVSTSLRLGLAWPVLFYLLCGELLRKALMPIVLRYSASVLATIGLVLIATGLVTTWKFDIQAHYIQSGDFGTQGLTPLIAIIVTAGFILVFATWINNTLYRLPAARAAVSRLVRTGTPVVFIHGLVLVWMYQNGFGEDSVQDYALRLSAAITISFAVALLVNSTPAARLLAGTRQEPNIFRHRHGEEF